MLEDPPEIETSHGPKLAENFNLYFQTAPSTLSQGYIGEFLGRIQGQKAQAFRIIETSFKVCRWKTRNGSEICN